MPILTKVETGIGWYFEQGTPTNGISTSFTLKIPYVRSSTPKVRKGEIYSNRETTRVRFKGKVNQVRNGSETWEYPLLEGYNEGWFEIWMYDNPRFVFYLRVTRHNSHDYTVKSFNTRDDCITSFQGKEGDYDLIHSPLDWEERRTFGMPVKGPVDRFDRIIEFGVKGADPEPSVEEVLESIVTPTPKKPQVIDDLELHALLEEVDVPKKPADPLLEELLEMLKNTST